MKWNPAATSVQELARKLAIMFNKGIGPDNLTESYYTKTEVVAEATHATSADTATLANNGCPVGAVLPFAMSTPPTGWLECNGAAVSRTTYAALFAAIGTIYGAGNGSTTFNVPDLRGEFIRGWDHGRGVDSGRAFGSAQTDALKSHTHTITYARKNGDLTGDYDYDALAQGSGDTLTSNATGGTETRPRNVALMYCIKY